MADSNVLIVEDEELMRNILRELVTGAGYTVFTADSAEAAIEIFSTNDIAATLTDIKMAGHDGLELLDQIKSIDSEAVVIIMTAYSSVDSAVAALRKGAYDYITKPFVNEDLLQTIRNAITQRNLFIENRLLRRELRQTYRATDVIGKSDAIQRVFDLVSKVASTNASVLILGETGTGKELIARAVHTGSGRSDKPFLAVNCGALPESLLESELFGHIKGSFTGATSDKRGLLRSAEGGTLFLDEIGDMPLPLQVKLLRALQEREVTPVGSTTPQRFDARVIAATHKNLEVEVGAGTFREDLYYRLNVVEISLPPLRERRDDIPLLIKHFVSRAARNQNAEIKPVSKAAMAALVNYDWPGNVRELENAIERAYILSSNEIDIESLPAKTRAAANGSYEIRDTEGFRMTLEELERRYVTEILRVSDGDKARAANILGVDLSTLYRKLKRYEEI
ncbi:MAG TPA: sigma-54 dependent transcriptional regulator [Pyrinomonadaceae bacterium]|nr:sigma-54 dependent transcriptional regulator [Pyrinomonadaceae bacterium]